MIHAPSRPPLYALIDCNNFFVSCERVFRPDLRDKPVVVMSNNDGCVVSRSNEAKALGIPMAVPMFQIKQLVERGKVELFSANFQLYGDFSQRVVQTLQHFCPRLEVYSVDESFAEISSLPVDDYAEWAAQLRATILQWTGIPVSIGIGSTKTLAKAAAEYAKKHPEYHGVLTLDQPSSLSREELLRWLPVGDIWGVGWRTAPKLREMGVGTAWALTQLPDGWVLDNMTIRGLRTVKELRGEPCLSLEEVHEPQQSIAVTRSFAHSIRGYHQLEGAVATFTARAAVKLRKQTEVATSVLVFLRTSKHAQTQHGASTVVRLVQPSADTGRLIEAALGGLQEIYDPDFGYKRAGIVLLGLLPMHAWQLSFLAEGPAQLDKRLNLMKAVDELNVRYGTRTVRHASEQVHLTQWHSKRERTSPRYTTAWTDLPRVG